MEIIDRKRDRDDDPPLGRAVKIGPTGHYTEHPNVVTVDTQQPRTRYQERQANSERARLEGDYVRFDRDYGLHLGEIAYNDPTDYWRHYQNPYAMVNQRAQGRQPHRSWGRAEAHDWLEQLGLFRDWQQS